MPSGVEFADKELDPETVVANVYDAAAEAEARELAERAAAEAQVDAADVPSDNGAKPEEATEPEAEKAE